MMFGTLCNAVLHKPKLVSLDEPEWSTVLR